MQDKNKLINRGR